MRRYIAFRAFSYLYIGEENSADYCACFEDYKAKTDSLTGYVVIRIGETLR